MQVSPVALCYLTRGLEILKLMTTSLQCFPSLIFTRIEGGESVCVESDSNSTWLPGIFLNPVSYLRVAQSQKAFEQTCSSEWKKKKIQKDPISNTKTAWQKEWGEREKKLKKLKVIKDT